MTRPRPLFIGLLIGVPAGALAMFVGLAMAVTLANAKADAYYLVASQSAALLHKCQVSKQRKWAK